MAEILHHLGCKNLTNNGEATYQLVQDFSHQQYVNQLHCLSILSLDTFLSEKKSASVGLLYMFQAFPTRRSFNGDANHEPFKSFHAQLALRLAETWSPMKKVFTLKNAKCQFEEKTMGKTSKLKCVVDHLGTLQMFAFIKVVFKVSTGNLFSKLSIVHKYIKKITWHAMWDQGSHPLPTHGRHTEMTG